MPEWLTEWFAADPSYSYVTVALLFVLCGLGLPLPEEIILVSAGYLCYQGHAEYLWMTLNCAGAILIGDVVPFLLGNLFGPRLLRLKWLRLVINRQRLATFDRWFRRRGDMVILIARFIPGLRVVAFFTGGTMRMRWRRFLLLDTCGIALTAPTFVFVGWHFGAKIQDAFRWVQQIEGALLYGALAGGAIFALWYWLRQRARKRVTKGPKDTYVAPSESSPEPEAPALLVETESEPRSGEAPAEPGVDIPQPERAPDPVPKTADPGEETPGSDEPQPKPGQARGDAPDS